MTSYQYASTEVVTDQLERSMDPYKLLREAALIQALIGFEWRRALDFGCGSGRYFPLFRKAASVQQIPRRLLGIDADPARIEAARMLLGSLANEDSLAIDLLVENASVFQTALSGSQFDLILCSHVLEHVTEDSFQEILAGIFAAVARGGRVVLLFQGFWKGPIGDRDLSQSDEYLHLIDTRRPPNTPGYRIDVSSIDFQNSVRKPQHDLLPVRALAIGAETQDHAGAPPDPVEACPVRLAPYLADFDWLGLLYATHLADARRRKVLIGDFIYCFDRR